MSKIAFVLGSDFEDSEFQEPYDSLSDEGHTCTIIGTSEGEKVHGKQGKSSATIEATADKVSVNDFDALVIPGGYSPDHLRTHEPIVQFVRQFVDSGKPVASICHGAQLLIEADVVRNKTITSWPSVRTDLRNAGAEWVDREVVEDGNLITSRNPSDIPAFVQTLQQRLAA